MSNDNSSRYRGGMSYSCERHGWRHLLKSCPSCEVTTSSSQIPVAACGHASPLNGIRCDRCEIEYWKAAYLEARKSGYSEGLEESQVKLASLEEKIQLAEEALELIAAPKRADGTYNRCHEACEELARTTLAEILKAEGPSNVAFAATKGSEE